MIDLERKSRLKPYISLSPWQRRLLIGVAASLSSQLYLSVWAEGFRISAAAILYPIFLVTMMRSSHLPDAGTFTAVCLVAWRVILSLLGGGDPWISFLVELPNGIFYLCYDALLCLLIRDRRTASYKTMLFSFVLCDFGANLVNLTLSSRALPGNLWALALIAAFRGSLATGLLFCGWYYHQMLSHQEHERRYQRLFMMTAELKTELYFLKKDSEDIEGVMSRAYRLYERLGELGVPEEEQALAMSIAREVHEIKKDNLRIIRGIEGEVADVYSQEEMHLSDLFRILEDSTRRMLGEQRSDIRLECWCGADLSVRSHFRLLSLLKNLVTNAMEAIQSDSGMGTVRVSARAEEEYLILSVSDDGPGLTPRAQNNLFRVGYSTKFDPKTGNIGRGVGLPAVQFIVADMNGTIHVDSTPGKGACFTVRLPLSAVQGEET